MTIDLEALCSEVDSAARGVETAIGAGATEDERSRRALASRCGGAVDPLGSVAVDLEGRRGRDRGVGLSHSRAEIGVQCCSQSSGGSAILWIRQ